MVHGVHHNVLLEHGGLPFIFPSDVHLDWTGHHCDTLWYLRHFYLKHVIPLRSFKTVLDNVLLDHGVLIFAVHLDLGHLPDTQGYLGLLSEP